MEPNLCQNGCNLRALTFAELSVGRDRLVSCFLMMENIAEPALVDGLAASLADVEMLSLVDGHA